MRQPFWKARYFSGLTLGPPSQSAVNPPCEWPATPIRSGVDIFSPERVVQEKTDVEADIDRPLPQPVGEIGDRRIIGVGAIVVRRGDDVAVRRKELGEPGIIESVAPASMRVALLNLGVFRGP
jgi:hypothetical protein